MGGGGVTHAYWDKHKFLRFYFVFLSMCLFVCLLVCLSECLSVWNVEIAKAKISIHTKYFFLSSLSLCLSVYRSVRVFSFSLSPLVFPLSRSVRVFFSSFDEIQTFEYK